MRPRGWTRSRLAGCLIVALGTVFGLEVSYGVRRFVFGSSGRASGGLDRNAQPPDEIRSPRSDGPSRPARRGLAALPAIPVDGAATRLEPAWAKGSIVTAEQVQAVRRRLAGERLLPVEERLRLGGALAPPGEAWQGQADGIRKELRDSLAGVPAASISDERCNRVGCRFSIESPDANIDVSVRGRLAQLLRGETRSPFPGESIVSEPLAGPKGGLRRVVVLFREPAPQPEGSAPSELAEGDRTL